MIRKIKAKDFQNKSGNLKEDIILNQWEADDWSRIKCELIKDCEQGRNMKLIDWETQTIEAMTLAQMMTLQFQNVDEKIMLLEACEDPNGLDQLVGIIEKLRAPGGCPWDAEQTHKSLKSNLIEEAYEVTDAIDKCDMEAIKEELGDVLLQVVFHASIAKESSQFDMRDVIQGVCEKMIFRHPHVFGTLELDTVGQVLETWDEMKKEEKKYENYTTILKSIPIKLPALMRAFKIQKKAAKIGFDWEEIESVFDKIEEEKNELLEIYKSGNQKRIEEELGDWIFSLVNLARFLKVDPESALNCTNEKFIKRFEYIEKKAIEKGKNIEKMELFELDGLWNDAKKEK